jgi:myo-inositol-1(or 4)-monophosphatase
MHPVDPALPAFALALTRRVAAELLSRQSELRVAKGKGDAVDVVTQADAHSERLLTQALSARCPEHRIAGEEGTRLGPADSRWTWHLDPLDGTANYSRELPAWAVSVGLSYDHTPVLGIVAAPALGLTLMGGPGLDLAGVPARLYRGADLTGEVLAEATPAPDMKQWIVATDWPWALGERARTNRFLDHLAPRVRQFKTWGSAAVDLLHVALGRVDAYAISHIFPWDQCGGAAVCAALGYEHRRWDGSPWDLRHPDILVCRPGMWDGLKDGLG